MREYLLDGNSLAWLDVVSIARAEKTQLPRISLAPEGRERVLASRNYIESRLKAGEVMYGVNTGFGAFSSVRISDGEIVQLQKNLIRSHCTGVDTYLSREQVRAIMLLRANTLARGHSGIRPLVIEKILEFLNKDIVPAIPQKGSVGASGDLAPLSHLALALIGEGEIVLADGKVVPAANALQQENVLPLELQAKEGLSLINGCQVMTGIGLLALAEGRDLLWLADLAGAMSLEALRGSRTAFDPEIFATRPHPGEAATAANILKLLGPQSEISMSHANCSKVQDAYSLRCMPAVHGAVKDCFRNAIEVLTTEANASTDNPLIFVESDKVLSCGNFHGMPIAFQMDYSAIAFSALGSISERRIEKLINPAMSELPAFLAPKGGLNSGHMIVQVSAASLVSENKVLSHPASVDSIPTSADKEDHVSMGTIAARKFSQIINNVRFVLSMELLASAQALDLLRPLRPAAGVAAAHSFLRQFVPFAQEDRVFARDISAINDVIRNRQLLEIIHSAVGELKV